MDDGNTARGAEVVMAAVLQALAARDDADAAVLAPLTQPALHNWNGLRVGSLRPHAALREALGRSPSA